MCLNQYNLVICGEYKKSVNLKLNKEKIIKVLELLWQQTSDLTYYYYISGSINDFLSNKYNCLEFKWYTFSLQAIDEALVILSSKLMGDQKEEYSLYNILKFLTLQENHHLIDSGSQTTFQEIIDNFNKEILPIYKNLKDRRNKWQAHNTEKILKNNFPKNIEICTECYYKVHLFAFKNIPKLYSIFTTKTLSKESFTHIDDCQGEICKFINLLDDNGNLKNITE